MSGSDRLILFMGTEAGGLYEITALCSKMGLDCGMPRLSLRNPLAARHMPPHGNLWIWQAIRRFFYDLGLPPIAEIPPDRLPPEYRAYYSRLFARCLGRFAGNSYICADHLAALALDLILAGLYSAGQQPALFFFFSHPAREISLLRQKYGQAAPLSEFAWRNTVAAAVRHSGRNLRLIDMDQLDSGGMENLWAQIQSCYGADSHALPVPPLPRIENVCFSRNSIALDGATMRLYEALRHYADKSDWSRLEEAAAENHMAQVAQGGWQFVDTLDTGGVDAHGRRFLMQAEMDFSPEAASDGILQLPEDQAGWLALLDSTERKLLDARNNFELQLFMHTDSVHRRYMEKLRDELAICQQDHDRKTAKLRNLHKRFASRVRTLWQMRRGSRPNS